MRKILICLIGFLSIANCVDVVLNAFLSFNPTVDQFKNSKGSIFVYDQNDNELVRLDFTNPNFGNDTRLHYQLHFPFPTTTDKVYVYSRVHRWMPSSKYEDNTIKDGDYETTSNSEVQLSQTQDSYEVDLTLDVYEKEPTIAAVVTIVGIVFIAIILMIAFILRKMRQNPSATQSGPKRFWNALFSPEVQLSRRARYEQIESPQPRQTEENSNYTNTNKLENSTLSEEEKSGQTFAVISKPKQTPKRSFDDEEYVRY